MDVSCTFAVILRKEAVSAASVHPRHVAVAGEQGRRWACAPYGEAACRRGMGLGDWGLGRWARAWTMTASKAGGRSETPRGVTINLRNLEAWRSKGWLQTSKKDGVALGVGVGLGLHGEIVVFMECAELGSNLAVTSSSKLGSEISALVTHLPRGGI